MTWRGRFLQSFGRVAIPNITLYWVAFQIMAMFAIWFNPELAGKMALDTGKVLQGEWWRVLTFLFMPVSVSPIFSAFVLYFYWMMGAALESNWGTARYNLYLLIGAMMNAAAAFLPLLIGQTGGGSNYYLLESVFLAFAVLYPNYVILLFFILPVRVKWLAMLTGIILFLQLAFGDWTTKAMVIASLANFLIFFHRDIVDHIKFSHKRMSRQVKQIALSAPAQGDSLHRCAICSATERSAPQLEFRYCSTCGGKCFCLEHLKAHACVNENVSL